MEDDKDYILIELRKEDLEFLVNPFMVEFIFEKIYKMKLLELNIEDLHHNPFWSYKGRNDKEALIEPIPIDKIENDVAYIAKTNFILNDGTILLGYCSSEDDSGLDYTQPSIIFENKHINLFELMESNKNYKRILSDILKKNYESIFPIMIECIIKERGINYNIKFN